MKNDINNFEDVKKNIFQSKIEKVFIELHNYSFNHTSSNQETSKFLGRKKLIRRLKHLITNSTTKTGVYLITGNRGVGKSSLVSEVIRQTSITELQWGTAKYILVLLGLTIIMQILSNQLNIYTPGRYNVEMISYACIRWTIGIICLLICLSCFMLIGHHSMYRRKTNRYADQMAHPILRTIYSGIKELEYFKLSSISPKNDFTLYKILLIVSLIELLSLITKLSSFQLLLIYIFWISINSFFRYSYEYLCKEVIHFLNLESKSKEGRNKLLKMIKCKRILNLLVAILTIIFFATSYLESDSLKTVSLRLYIALCLLILAICIIWSGINYAKAVKHSGKDLRKKVTIVMQYLYDITLHPLKNITFHYFENYNRVFLKINLGHDILKERDVLILISRTVLTAFSKYYHSIRRTILWKLIAFSSVLLLTFIIHKVIFEPIEIEIIENSKSVAPEILSSINRSVTWVYNSLLDFPSYLMDQQASFTKMIEKYKEDNLSRINYSFILLFIAIFIICRFLLGSKSINITSPYKIKRQLKKLNDSITFEIANESARSGKINPTIQGVDLSVGKSRSKKRTIADEREIEKELSDILDDIQNIPFFMAPPNMVIVFDELDKVEPEDNAFGSRTKGSMFSLETIRDRQSAILKLLINLKFFLTNAKVKFIFIAGREMYDIYLADITDRNNFIGTIFHDVLNVPSFLSDHSNEKINDLTALTEEFVCKCLIPESYPTVNYNLQAYVRYLDSEIYLEKNNADIEMQKNKTIAILHQFILYLAYVSKGAPKKIVQQFENFIEITDKRELDNRFHIKQYRNTKYFLAFDYQDQYVIGMIAYLINPVFLKLKTTNVQKHSDKLLVSSLFTLDFIYKYHNHSFSWKDISSSPEMLEVNKAPELSPMINDLLFFLSQFHIERSSSGFNELRFDYLISLEMSFLSKIYENFSAIYNFSLDESLSVKQYYLKLLNNELEKYKNNSHNELIHAIASLNVRLGDLYFYDDELEVANAYYKNGIQALRNKDINKLDIDQLYFLVKNMMKLGFVYEKRKLYDFAYLTYGELTKLLMQIRDFDIHNLGLSIRLDNKNRLRFIKSSDDTNLLLAENKPNHEILKFEKSIQVRKLEDEKDIEPIATVQPLSFAHLSKDTQSLLFKNSAFEGLKLLYLPLLAKFQIIEKSHFGGIRQQDLDELIKEFRFLKRMINHKERNLLISDFYSRIGEILFYKNQDFVNTTNGKTTSISACFFYKKAIIYLFQLYDLDNDADQFDISVIEKSITNILSHILTKYLSEKHQDQTYTNLLARILSDWGDCFLSCDSSPCYKKYKKDELDNQKCKLDNCPLNTEDFKEDFLNKWWDFMVDSEKVNISNLLNKNKTLSKFEIVLLMYSLSSKFYMRSNLNKRSVFQINKILILFKHYLSISKNKELFIFTSDKEYLEKLTEKAISSIYLAYDDVNIYEVKERKKDFDTDNISLKYLLLDSKIDRLKIVLKEIELICLKNGYCKKDGQPVDLKSFLSQYFCIKNDNKHITSRYEINFSVSARIYRLRNKAQLNWYLLSYLIDVNKKNRQKIYAQLVDLLVYEKSICKDEIESIFDYQMTNQEILERLITDSIFCYKEMIKLSKTTGEPYFFNHSFYASTHHKLEEWTFLYEAYVKLLNVNSKDELDKLLELESDSEKEPIAENFDIIKIIHSVLSNSQIEKYLYELFGEEWKQQLSSYYEYHQALTHYHKTIETHSGGRAYHHIIDNFYYMNDDYNDRIIHFNVALERALLSIGKVQLRLDELKNSERSQSRLLQPSSYF